MTNVQLYCLIGSFIVSALGFFINAYATFRNISSRKLSNYQEIVKSHRDIWKITIDKPEIYGRILEKGVDLSQNPITYQEKLFIQLVLLHMTSAFSFSKQSEMVKISKLKYDFDDFISLTIPNEVWKDVKEFYNSDFVKFIDNPAKNNLTALRKYVGKKIALLFSKRKRNAIK